MYGNLLLFFNNELSEREIKRAILRKKKKAGGITLPDLRLYTKLQ